MKKITFFVLFILMTLTLFSAWEAPDISVVKESYLTIYSGVLDIIDSELLDGSELQDELTALRDQLEKSFDPSLLGDYTDRIETKGILMVDMLVAFYQEKTQIRLVDYQFFDALKRFLSKNPLYVRAPSDETAAYFSEIDAELIRLPDRIIKTRGFFYYKNNHKYHYNDTVYYYIPAKYMTKTPVKFSDAIDNYIDESIMWNDEWFVETMGYLNEKFGFSNPYRMVEEASQTGIVLRMPSEQISYVQKEIKGFRVVHGSDEINENEVLSAAEYEDFCMATSTCFLSGYDYPFKPMERLNDAVYKVNDGLMMHVEGFPDRASFIIQSASFYPRPYNVFTEMAEIKTKPRDLTLEKMDEEYESLLINMRDLIEEARKAERGDFNVLKDFVNQLDENFQPYWQYFQDDTQIKMGMIENLSLSLQKRIEALLDNLDNNALADGSLIEDIRVVLKENPQRIRVMPDDTLQLFSDNGISFDRMDAVIVGESGTETYLDARYITSRPVDFFKLAEAVERISGNEIDEAFIDDRKPEALQSTDTTLIAYTVILDMMASYFIPDQGIPEDVRAPHVYCSQYGCPSVDQLTAGQLDQFLPVAPSFIFYTEDGVRFKELFKHYMWMFLNNHLDDIQERDEFPCTLIMDAGLFEPTIR